MATVAQEVDIANDLVAELNSSSRTWTIPFDAQRTYSPWIEGEDLTDLVVRVVPLEIPNAERQSRGGTWIFDYKIAIDFQRSVPLSMGLPNAALIDELNYVAQQVFDFLKDGHVVSAAGENWRVTDLARPDIFVAPRLWVDHVWETVIEVTIRGFR